MKGMVIPMKNLVLALFLATGLLSQPISAQSHSVTLTWTWAQGQGPAATGFNIYRATTATGAFSVIGSTSVSTLTFTDTSSAVQVSGASFFYQVTAFNATSESAPSNTVGPETIPFALSAPGGLSGTVK